MESTVRGARTQSGIAAAPAQDPEQRSPKAEIASTLTKNKGKQKRALSSCESEDIASIPMELLRTEQSLALWCLSASLLLSSCGAAGPECGSLDTRNSVVKIVSDDTNNKLVNYAVKNSSSVATMLGDTKSEAEKSGILEKARQGAVYRLDDTILMNSRNRAVQEVTCIGLLYVTVADATAQKEIEFKVKQTADGKIIVSVNPFLF
jgi:hypothetical protein